MIWRFLTSLSLTTVLFCVASIESPSHLLGNPSTPIRRIGTVRPCLLFCAMLAGSMKFGSASSIQPPPHEPWEIKRALLRLLRTLQRSRIKLSFSGLWLFTVLNPQPRYNYPPIPTYSERHSVIDNYPHSDLFPMRLWMNMKKLTGIYDSKATYWWIRRVYMEIKHGQKLMQNITERTIFRFSSFHCYKVPTTHQLPAATECTTRNYPRGY